MVETAEQQALSGRLVAVLERMEGVLLDQTTAFREMTQKFDKMVVVVTNLSSSTSNGNEADQKEQEEDEDVPDNPEGMANKAQEEFMPYDREDIYHTLVDPYQRSKEELSEYANVAAQLYVDGQYPDLGEAFGGDFEHWKEEHFKLLPNVTVATIRDALIDGGLPVQKRVGLKIYKSLADYIDQYWSEARKRHQIDPGGKHSTKPIRDDVKVKFEKEYPQIGEMRNPYRGDEVIKERKARPGDVGKLFPKENRYGGGPKEPIRRRWEIFIDSCQLCDVDTSDPVGMFRLMQTGFLRGPALVYFMDVVKREASSPEGAIEMLESHFLDDRAKRVNDEVWLELTFEFVKSKRSIHNQDVTHEGVLNDLLTQISELADMRTGSGNSADVMAKTISAVREVDVFSHVCRNPPRELQALNSALRSCALEADRASIRATTHSGGYVSNGDAAKSFAAAAQEFFQSYYVDRNLRTSDRLPDGRRKFKGYGRGEGSARQNRDYSRRYPEREKKKLPWDVCIICEKKGCHSSNHQRMGRQAFKRIAKAYIAGEVGDDDSDTQSGSENEGEERESDAYIVFARCSAAMGVAHRESQHVVDAALIDTGCSKLSLVGEQHVPAVRAVSTRRTTPNLGRKKVIDGVGGSVSTLGTMKFHFTFGGRDYQVMLNIVPNGTPLIISHQDLDHMGLNYQSLYKIVERPEDGYVQQVDFRNGLPFLVFPSVGYLSVKQLQTIHRNLGHPSVEKQMQLIESAGINDLPRGLRKQVTEIVKHCRACQLKQGRPRRFLFSIRDPIAGEFNHIIQVDVVKLIDGNVLHATDMGTGFQFGRFINKMDAPTAWRMLRHCWVDVYAGAPDYIHTDAGSNFNAEEFKKSASEMGSIVRIAPTEGHDRIGLVERSHATLKAVYEKLRLDLRTLSREDRLSMSFRAVNDVPNSTTGISPTTLVFGVYPKLPGGGNRGDMAQRAHIIRQCTEMVIKMRARRVLRDSTRLRNVPSVEEMGKVRNIPAGKDVLVYREKGGWTPYTLVRIRGNEVDVILPGGKISTFAINVVRPFYEEDELSETRREENGKVDSTGATISTKPQRDGIITRSKARKMRLMSHSNAFLSSSPDREFFRESRMEEITSLQNLGCFKIVAAVESEGHRLYRSTFVDKVKPSGEKRSRLCVAACNDTQHGLFTAAPTIKRLSLRLLLAVARMFQFTTQIRDVTKAFVMSNTKLRRPVYLRAPSEMGIPKGMVLKVIKPLYGMPESPIHWFKTYTDYHREKLQMEQAVMDTCLLFRRNATSLMGIIGMQVDDTLCAGNKEFIVEENEKSSEFPSKGKQVVGGTPLRFNGVDMSLTGNDMQVEQKTYITRIGKLKRDEQLSFEQFRSLRAQYAYAAFSTVPNGLVYVAQLAQYTATRYKDGEQEAMKLMRKCQKVMHSDASLQGLKYVPIPPDRAEVVVCIDAAFAINHDNSSQLGMVAMIRDTHNGKVNVIHYASAKSKRVCKSVLAAELFALVDGYDLGYCIAHQLGILVNRKVNLTIYTDSHSLYGLCISLSQTTERRLQIDLALIREAYEKRDITQILWIEGKSNPADDLTKPDRRNGTLAKLVSSNHFLPDSQAWVQRDLSIVTTTQKRDKFDLDSSQSNRKTVECCTNLSKDATDVGNGRKPVLRGGIESQN